MLVFDPSAFKKQGKESVGVARQWCGRLGKIENCQVGVYLGYVSRKEHALVDVRLYLNKEWAKDRRRRKKCGVPGEIRFRTRHALALEMLAEHGATLPHGWIAGDDEMGRSSAFRRDLRALGERYLLAVPSNTLIRDLEAAPPEYSGRGPRPQAPFVRVDRWRQALPKNAWTKIEVRDGARGPLVVEAVKRRVQAKADRRRNGPEEILVVFREKQGDGTMKHDYCLSNAAAEMPLTEFSRVGKAEHRIEECLERAQERGGVGPVSGSQLDWLASSSDTLAAGDVVPDARRSAGEKNTPRPSRCQRFRRSLPRCYAAPSTAAVPPISAATTPAA